MELGSYSEMANISKLKSFKERFKAFSLEHFEEKKSTAMSEKHHRVVSVWNEACLVCQEVRQTLEEKLLEFDRKQKLERFQQRDDMLKNDGTPLQTSCLTSSSLANAEAQFQQNEDYRQTNNQGSHSGDKSVKIHKDSASASILTAKLVKYPREHHSEDDLRNVDLLGKSERNRALGRSHSEGSCVRSFGSILSGCSLSVCQKPSTSKPSKLLAARECVACHQGTFCSDFSNIQLSQINSKPIVSSDQEDSPISRQESFSSSVSSPRQGWVKEVKSSRIYLGDRNSHCPSRDPITDRLEDTSDCSSATELDNSSNLL